MSTSPKPTLRWRGPPTTSGDVGFVTSAASFICFQGVRFGVSSAGRWAAAGAAAGAGVTAAGWAVADAARVALVSASDGVCGSRSEGERPRLGGMSSGLGGLRGKRGWGRRPKIV